jgi:hypothetical protein
VRPGQLAGVRKARKRSPTAQAEGENPHPQATAGLNDISVLSKACYASSLNRNKAAIWRISPKTYFAMDHFNGGIISILPTAPLGRPESIMTATRLPSRLHAWVRSR